LATPIEFRARGKTLSNRVQHGTDCTVTSEAQSRTNIGETVFSQHTNHVDSNSARFVEPSSSASSQFGNLKPVLEENSPHYPPDFSNNGLGIWYLRVGFLSKNRAFKRLKEVSSQTLRVMGLLIQQNYHHQ
jgi:hypothetical protein